MVSATTKYKNTYNKFAPIFRERLCTLLIGEEEFIKQQLTASATVSYRARCGHERSIVLKRFPKATDACLDCTQKEANEKQRETKKTLGRTHTMSMEATGFNIFRAHLDDRFELERLPEGTRADCILRPATE